MKAAYEKTAYLAQDYACRLDFESNTADSSDNGFDFTGKGTALTYEKGVNGGTAARFTGGSYLQASKTLALGTGDYSFSFWIDVFWPRPHVHGPGRRLQPLRQNQPIPRGRR